LAIKVADLGHGAVITGKLLSPLVHETTGLSPDAPDVASLYFFNDLRVPFNKFVNTESTANGQNMSSQMRPALAQFTAGGLDIQVNKVEGARGSTIVRASCAHGALHAGIETRIEETLRYVTMSPVRWAIVDKRVGTTRKAMVIPRRELQPSFFSEPVDHDSTVLGVEFWRLFAAYLEHVLKHDDPESYHALSAQIFHLTAGETKQLDLLGLITCVAAEGVLQDAYVALAPPSIEFQQRIKSVTKLLRRIQCVDEVLRRRLGGTISQMIHSRPGDKLNVLEEAGVVTKEMVGAWRTLRNATAHASLDFDPAALPKTWRACLTV
jgi:hypothetical protein